VIGDITGITAIGLPTTFLLTGASVLLAHLFPSIGALPVAAMMFGVAGIFFVGAVALSAERLKKGLVKHSGRRRPHGRQTP
jgi:hypothetical protein